MTRCGGYRGQARYWAGERGYAGVMNSDDGVRAEELPALKAGILALAAGIYGIAAPVEVNQDAAELARTSTFSYADWLYAVKLIERHPEYDGLLAALRDAARFGYNPQRLASDLVGDGIERGILSYFDGNLPNQ